MSAGEIEARRSVVRVVLSFLGWSPEGRGFRNSVSVRRFGSSTRSAAESVSPGYQAVIGRDRWPGNESSSFDVDRADLVFARA